MPDRIVPNIICFQAQNNSIPWITLEHYLKVFCLIYVHVISCTRESLFAHVACTLVTMHTICRALIGIPNLSLKSLSLQMQTLTTYQWGKSRQIYHHLKWQTQQCRSFFMEQYQVTTCCLLNFHRRITCPVWCLRFNSISFQPD